jgi:hypothetical protein
MEHPFGEGEYVDALNQIASLVPLSPFGVDTEKARANKRSWNERIAPRSDFGHGSIQASTGSEVGRPVHGLRRRRAQRPADAGWRVAASSPVRRSSRATRAATAGMTPRVITAAREASEAAARTWPSARRWPR